MITPVDFRQKSFRTGIGYDKKDVDNFMVELLRNYEELYRSNAQQIAEIKDLNDNLIRFKAMEESLQRQLMVAEKTSEEMVNEATDKAKMIEKDAKTKAKELLKTAKADLAFVHKQTVAMAQMYASMKAQLNKMFKNYVDVVNGEDMSMDIDALEAFGNVSDDIKEALNAAEIVPEMNFAASAFIPNMPMPGASASASNAQAFGSFDGDPQMRETSTLSGAANSNTVEGQLGDVSSAGFGFTSLAENDSYKDPFANVKVESTNQFDDSMTDPFKNVSGGADNNTTASKKTKKKAEAPVVEPASEAAKPAKSTPTKSVKETEVPVQEEVVQEAAPAAEEPGVEESHEEEIPTVSFVAEESSDASEETVSQTLDEIGEEFGIDSDDEEALEGDIEDKPKGTRLLGDGEDPDEDFSFV